MGAPMRIWLKPAVKRTTADWLGAEAGVVAIIVLAVNLLAVLVLAVFG